MIPSESIEFELVDHINMYVRNLSKSMEFYQRVFGTDGEIKQSGERKGVQWVIIGLPHKFYFCLYELKGKEFNEDDLHINHIGFYVKDFEETVKRIRNLGVEIEYRGEPIAWSNRNGTTRSIYIKDPNGYIIEFAEKLGGGLD